MPIELIRLAVGLLIAMFHRRIADYMLHHERALVVAFSRRGLRLPQPPTTETTRNIYFGLGIFLAIFQICRIWLLLHPSSSVAALMMR